MLTIDLDSGSLGQTPIPLLLKKISNDSLTGRLSITSESGEKQLFFKDGQAITAHSTAEAEQLANLMYQGGVFEKDVYEQIKLLIKEGGWRTPQVEAVVDAKTQKWWMRSVLREVMLSVYELEEGEYTFENRKSPPSSLVVVEMDTERLMLSILRRIQSIETLARILGGVETVLKIDYSAFTGPKAKTLTAEDGFFLSRIDGNLKLKDILSLAGGQKLEMAQCYIQALTNGFIEFTPPKPVEKMANDAQVTADEAVIDDSVTEPEEEFEEVIDQNIKDQNDSDSQDIMLTTDELKDLRKLAGHLDSDFLDLSKDIDLDNLTKPQELDYDVKISYQRGDEFITSDGSDGAYDIDKLGKVTSSDEMLPDVDDDRISFIIDGKTVDGETDIIGGSITREIFEVEDEEKQWNLWMVSEEEMEQDFEQDWTTTWSDWMENTQELTTLKEKSVELEANLRAAKTQRLKDSIMKDLRSHNLEMEQLIERKKRQIFAVHRRIQVMSFYEILKLDRTASTHEIEMAHNKWEEELSPNEETFAQLAGIAPQINEVIQVLDTAYKTLIDPEKRAEYDLKLDEQERASEVIKEKKKLLAEDHMMSARTAIRRGDKMLAMRFLRGSMSLDSANPLYFREMANILAENPNWRKEALRFYHRAFHLNPENLDILLDVANLAFDLNLKGFAKKSLKHILDAKPSHIKAKRLLKKINSTA